MKRLVTLSAVLVFTFAGCQQAKQSQSQSDQKPSANIAEAKPAPQPKYASFGAPAKLSDADAIPVEKLMASPDEYKGKFIRLTGTVDKVCPRKGCWLTLKG